MKAHGFRLNSLLRLTRWAWEIGELNRWRDENRKCGASNGKRKPSPPKYSSLHKKRFFKTIKKPRNSPLWEYGHRQIELQVVERNGHLCGIISQLLQEVDGGEPWLLSYSWFQVSDRKTVWLLPREADFQRPLPPLLPLYLHIWHLPPKPYVTLPCDLDFPRTRLPCHHAPQQTCTQHLQWCQQPQLMLETGRKVFCSQQL